MDPVHKTNEEQATLWNGPAGRAWVETQALLDGVLAPFENLLVEAVAASAVGRVLDVGCGTGATTIAIARRLGASARCLGVDISEPMIAAARDRAEGERSPARFIVADAQVHPFEPGCFDMIVSRFGVMFFDEPVEAFANLRRAARPGAELRFVAWRGAAENAFMTTVERAAAPLLPDLPARRPGAPGQFAFGDPQRVATVLAEGGWQHIDIRPVDVVCTLPESELVRYITWLGPVGVALQKADDATRTRVIEAVRAAFEPYVRGAEVCFEAACWMTGGRAPAA